MPGFYPSLATIPMSHGLSPNIRPMLTYMWIVPAIVGDRLDGEGDAQILLKEVTPPNYTITDEKVQGGAITYKYAKSILWEDTKVTFYDTGLLYKRLDKWAQTVHTNDGGLAPSENYKKDTKISRFNIDGSDAGGWVLKNSWVKQVSWTSLTYTTSDLMNVSATISFDWAETT